MRKCGALTNAWLLQFHKASSFSQSECKNTHFFTNPLSCLFSKKVFFVLFSTPVRNCAKYQHHTKTKNWGGKITKLQPVFYIFRWSNKIFKNSFICFRSLRTYRWTTVPNLLQFGWNFQTAHPRSLTFQLINKRVQYSRVKWHSKFVCEITLDVDNLYGPSCNHGTG